MKLEPNALQLAMIRKGINRINELAALLGMSNVTASKMLNGRSVSLETVARVAKALQVDPAEIVQPTQKKG